MADTPETKPKRRLSPEEILTEIHGLAQDGDGADRRWALKQLSVGDASITLPTPKSEEELQQRLGRMLRAVGEESARRAYGKAFPAGVPASWSIARKRGKLYVPTTLKELYELFPEAEKDLLTGAPPEYPLNSSVLKKRRWVADYAMKLNKARDSESNPTELGSEISRREELEMGESRGD